MKTFRKLYKKTSGGGTQVWQISVHEFPDKAEMVTTYGLDGGKMQVKREAITAGKNLGKKNATTAYEQACAEAQSRWNKQKDRKGYGFTVEESAAVRAASPMLAHPYEKHAKKVDWGNAFAQPKLDGFRCLVRIGPDGRVTMTSRENQPFTALADMRDVIADVAKNSRLFVPDATEVVLDGELYCHGMSLNEISSACKRKSDKTKLLKYHVYDAAMGAADFATRNRFARDFVEAAGSDLLVPVDTVKVRTEQELMRCQAEFMEAGFEGAMLRYGAVGYQAGKRSPHLLKVKTWLDAEFKVVDAKEGRGAFAGAAVFTCVTPAGHHFEVTAPGTMAEKQAFWKNWRAYVGKKLTVRYQYMTRTEEPVPFLPVAHAFRE